MQDSSSGSGSVWGNSPLSTLNGALTPPPTNAHRPTTTQYHHMDRLSCPTGWRFTTPEMQMNIDHQQVDVPYPPAARGAPIDMYRQHFPTGRYGVQARSGDQTWRLQRDPGFLGLGAGWSWILQ
jgi:hypothetical protein